MTVNNTTFDRNDDSLIDVQLAPLLDESLMEQEVEDDWSYLSFPNITLDLLSLSDSTLEEPEVVVHNFPVSLPEIIDMHNVSAIEYDEDDTPQPAIFGVTRRTFQIDPNDEVIRVLNFDDVQ
jgi:hypothetical protein